MRYISIENKTSPLTELIKVPYCDSFFSRLRGLMFTPNITKNGGCLIVESNDSRVNSAIHMFFMNFDITAIWINSKKQIVDVQLARRWHPIYTPVAPACYILELHADRLANFKIGDQIEFQDA
jgi:uncharacterized membrane protein (UPF0127 family)